MKFLQQLIEAEYIGPQQKTQSPTRIIRKIVRKAADDNGWEIFDARTDKTPTGRRISFWMSGWPVPKSMKAAILDQVNRDLQRGSLPGKVSWHKAEGYRGTYDKLVVKVPRDLTPTDKKVNELKRELQRIRRKGNLHKPGSPTYKRISELLRQLEDLGS